MSKRRAIDSFFKPSVKKAKYELSSQKSQHPTYPFPIPYLPDLIQQSLNTASVVEGTVINDQPDLDLLYFQPFIPKDIHQAVFEFLRQELFYYRVQYTINRGGVETIINTPRYTTVFGVDTTSCFGENGKLLDSETKKPILENRYKCRPRPIPQCLSVLKKITEEKTAETYNFCLVNFYADGNDSISYHSDDERFLGQNPAIASFSLGAKRDFLMKHKPRPPSKDHPAKPEVKPLKFTLGPGEMILMRGRTQSNWLHSVPKRAGGEGGQGRINITFRKALVKGGTENYYQYNVGSGNVFRWNAEEKKMGEWTAKESI
ncbi:2OG-Fe(II) oxygenase [Delitschia confertaspora ATCC 74209]|uniref:2OG-Fe(II) oxygenase n=1 Tax=Delitschia confertaspora ATCC 74209 TaxID=1513339 RepID=A0A9P4JQJ8_9PLEO|nr:2OG-Fe(II) oxygenase [Delitschia confertaspora ATCC 74209]